ncbi:MAG: hypothetical protein AAF127_05390 [Pseudomonadota bacterium]
MAQVTGTLIEGKPIVDITLADALPAPPEVSSVSEVNSFSVRQYRALLDTGADITCICEHAVRESGLKQYGFERMIGAVGPSLHETYIVKIGILLGDSDDADRLINGLFQLEPLVAAKIKDNKWFDLIIGTDILRNHEFALTRGGGFRLELFG